MDWIPVNKQLTDAITLINETPLRAFKSVLGRIATSASSDCLNDQEIIALKERVKMEELNVQLLVQGIAYLYKHASKIILKPIILRQQLIEELHMEENHADVFIKIWVGQTSTLFDLNKMQNVDEVDWELCVQGGNNVSRKDITPVGRMKLGLVSDDMKNNLILEMGDQELSQFYAVLENIQAKLDSIR